jgi:hypothetical protein
MRRRLFLQAGLAAAAGALWLPRRRARADASCPKPGTGTDGSKPGATHYDINDDAIEGELDGQRARKKNPLLADARRRAKAAGRTLLVVVAPVNREARRERGESLAALLEYGAPEALYPLAFAEPVVATVEELDDEGLHVAGEPALVGVAPSGTIASASPKRKNEMMIPQLELAGLLAEVIAAPAATAAERARLGGAAQDQWRRHAIPGSRWGYTLGCSYHRPAITTDDDDVSHIGCGMGSLEPHASRRFVNLYAGAMPPRRAR